MIRASQNFSRRGYICACSPFPVCSTFDVFITRFLNRIEAAVPAGKLIHAILDNYAAHQASQSPRLARPAPALDVSLHANLLLLAECCRRLFCHADPAAIAALRLPFARRPASGDQPLSRRAQPQNKTLHLDRPPRSDYRKGHTWVPTDRITLPGWLETGQCGRPSAIADAVIDLSDYAVEVGLRRSGEFWIMARSSDKGFVYLGKQT